MKKKIYQYSILIVILLGFTSTAKGQFRETKEFKKAIKVSTAGRLAVSNRHGKINVSYEIRVPKSLRLRIDSKYGDIYIDQHDGRVGIELSHGNLRANSLGEVEYLRTNFGDVYINSVESLEGSLLFSQIEIEKATKIDIVSKSTGFEIESVEALQMSSSNDKIDIDEVGHFGFTGSLSKVNIDELTKSSNISLKYGKVKIKKIHKDVCSFMATATRCTLELGLDKEGNKNITGMIGEGEIQNLNPLLKIKSKYLNLSAVMGNIDKANCTYQLSCQKTKLYFK